MSPIMLRRMNLPSPGADVAAQTAVRFNVHGIVAELRCALPALRQVLADIFGSLIVDEVPDGLMPIEGVVEAYDADVVARHVSPRAERLACFGDYAELWRDGDRAWLLDDGWGLCEINLLRRSFRSWVLPQSPLGAIRAVEQAIVWPMAQVMLSRGLSLVPAASIVHRGRGILLVSPFSLEPELVGLLEAGAGLIAQRWTALREEDGRPLMLTMPGRIERAPTPQLRAKANAILSIAPPRNEWADLALIAHARCNYSWCDVVIVVEPGRRAAPRLTSLTGASAAAAIRRAWPMPDVNGNRQAQFATRLAQTAQVFQVELARDPKALLRLVESLPINPSPARSLLDAQVAAPTRTRVAG